MGREYSFKKCLNKPMQRESDFEGWEYFSKIPCPPYSQLACSLAMYFVTFQRQLDLQTMH